MICLDSPPAGVVLHDAASVAHNPTLLGDIADMSRLPGRLRLLAAHIPIAHLAPGVHAVQAAQIASVARAHMPILGCFLQASSGTVHIHVDRPASVSARTDHIHDNAVILAEGAVRRGDAVAFATQIGAVRIERQVEALQAGRSGHRLFVRDQDGKTFPIRLEAEAQ